MSVIRPDGTGARAIADPDAAYDYAWSPDGQRIVVGEHVGDFGDDQDELASYDVVSGHRQTVARIAGVWRPAWSPNGTLIAFLAETPDSGYDSVFVVHPDGTGLRKVAGRAWSVIHRAAFTGRRTVSAFIFVGSRQTSHV